MDAVFNTFQPGSMTGASKLRSVKYWQSWNKKNEGLILYKLCVTGRKAEFSVVIQTCVFDGVGVSAGGAIVALSCAEEIRLREYTV
jgi:anthranilate/para-aminobenzoate synthase component I